MKAANTPKHIAIIMDGNGRWAKQHKLPRIEGHRRGAEAVKRTLKAAQENGVKNLTLFALASKIGTAQNPKFWISWIYSNVSLASKCLS